MSDHKFQALSPHGALDLFLPVTCSEFVVCIPCLWHMSRNFDKYLSGPNAFHGQLVESIRLHITHTLVDIGVSIHSSLFCLSYMETYVLLALTISPHLMRLKIVANKAWIVPVLGVFALNHSVLEQDFWLHILQAPAMLFQLCISRFSFVNSYMLMIIDSFQPKG